MPCDIGGWCDQHMTDEEPEQYTGLKDKNGKLTFNGDVGIYEKFIPGMKWEICAFDDASLKAIPISNGVISDDARPLTNDFMQEFKIIGNIHEGVIQK